METRAPKVLVVGVDGEIGSYVFSDLQHAGFETLGTSLSTLAENWTRNAL